MSVFSRVLLLSGLCTMFGLFGAKESGEKR